MIKAKKIQFLKLFINLGLNVNNRVFCSHERIEKNKPINPPRKFDAIISRAVTQIKPFLDIITPIRRKWCCFYNGETENIKQERLELKSIILIGI